MLRTAKLRVLLGFFCLAPVIAGERACAQQARQVAQNPIKLDSILDAWERSSARIQTLSATILRSHRKNPWGGKLELEYRVRYRRTGLAVLEIREHGNKQNRELWRVVWTRTNVWLYDPSDKEILIYTRKAAADYQEFRATLQRSLFGGWLGNNFDWIFPELADPLAVEPLPFLVAFNKDSARKQYQFELLEADPARGAYVVRATPTRPELRASFRSILITLDATLWIPAAIQFERGRGGRDSRSYLVTGLEPNRDLPDWVFEPRRLEGWSMKHEGK